MINFRIYSNATEIIIPDEITLSTTDFSRMFSNMYNLKTVKIPNNITNMLSTFFYCNNLTGSPVCGDNVTTMASTYSGCVKLTGSPVCGNKVNDMYETYYNCTNLTGSPACGNNVTNMDYTYYNCHNLTGSPVCGDNVTNMAFTYRECYNLTGPPVCGDKVTFMFATYYQCYNLTGSPVCGDNVTYMTGTYRYCYNLTGSPVCGDKVTAMSYTYAYCTNLTGSPVCGLNVINMDETYKNCCNLTGSPVCGPKVTNMASTYEDCYHLTGSPVCGPNVTDMSGTYWGCANLTGSPVCGNKVIHMSRAYQHCYNLTGSPVCGPNVTSMIETYYNCTNLTGSPVCGNNVTSMSYTYWNCCNLTGKAICGPNVTSMSYTYTNCVNITNAIIGQKVTNIYKTYAGCSSLIDLTILSPWVKYNNTLTNANPNLKIYVPEESFNQYIESEWGLHGIFMNENRNIYLLTPSDTLLFFNEIKQHTLDFRKLNNNFSAISNVSVNSKDETIATISNVIINENSISFDMQSFEKEGTSMVTITYSDGIQTYSSTFQIYVFQNRPEFTYSIEPIEGANYTFVLDENEEYYQNNVTDGIEDYAICKIVLNANGAKKLYIDYSSDFYPNNYGYFSYLNETFELSNTEEENYLKRVGWNGESGTVDYGVIPFGRHEIYVKYYKCHWIEWGTGLFKFKIRIEDIDTQEN